jgi:hypothetical protein
MQEKRAACAIGDDLKSKGIPASPLTIESHYSVQFLAELWQLNESTVRRMFEDLPDVFKVGKGKKRKNGKREYYTLRIPASVAEREYRARLSAREKAV